MKPLFLLAAEVPMTSIELGKQLVPGWSPTIDRNDEFHRGKKSKYSSRGFPAKFPLNHPNCDNIGTEVLSEMAVTYRIKISINNGICIHEDLDNVV